MAEASDPRDNYITPFPTSETLLQLLNKQNKDAEVTRQKQKQLTKFKEDYEALNATLSTISDRVTHQVFVPMGKLAFFPGKVKHTNEILVLLGENWFVERSAKQAREIVQRRIKQCDESLKSFEKELKLLGGWNEQTVKFHEELGMTGGVNIVEKEEPGWREKHREKVREHRRKLAELKQQEEVESRHPRTDEEELWRRLDELELQEELQHEMDLLSGFDGEEEEDEEEDEEESEVGAEKSPDEEPPKSNRSIEVSSESKKESLSDSKSRRVTWGQEDSVRQFHRDEVLANSSSAADDNNGETSAIKITFKHSRNVGTGSGSLKRITSGVADTAAPAVSSPSDIYHHFGGQSQQQQPEAPRSILKVKKSTTPVIEVKQTETVEPDEPPRTERQHRISALSDEVKERSEEPGVQDVAANASSKPLPTEDETVNTHRPVSRFRAARLRNHNPPNL